MLSFLVESFCFCFIFRISVYLFTSLSNITYFSFCYIFFLVFLYSNSYRGKKTTTHKRINQHFENILFSEWKTHTQYFSHFDNVNNNIESIFLLFKCRHNRKFTFDNNIKKILLFDVRFSQN